MPSYLRIGIDVGGTNTDAVVLDPGLHATTSRGVIAAHKCRTTHDPATGIEQAVRAVLDKSSISPSQIASVTIGTTAFLNAVIEQNSRHLSRVAVIRLSKSFLRDVKPFSEWPTTLVDIIYGYIGYVDGGLHIDGSQEAPIVESQVVEQCQEIRRLGLTAVVVAGVYSPIDQEFQQEDKVRGIIRRELPGVDVVCSHEVANIGFLERENASILNAAILRFARRTVKDFQIGIARLGLSGCPLYLTQNDGTLLDAASAAQTPIRTFSSGVTNSMRGAAYLSGHGSKLQTNQSAIVVDIGGTTTDIGVLLPSGLPRQASAYAAVAGIKVNYSLPHIHSIGLGGGSLVERREDGQVRIGPRSVGSAITEHALIFGGAHTTATDIAVAAGLAQLGSPQAVSHLDREFVADARSRIKIKLEQAVDTVKTSPEPVPVFLVGGGSILAPKNLDGASELLLPPFHEVANAVGAACSKVGATIDTIENTSQQNLAEVIEKVKHRAIDKAVSLGGVRDTIVIAEVDAMPIPYLDNQVRIVVRAIGELDLTVARRDLIVELEEADRSQPAEITHTNHFDESPSTASQIPRCDHNSYRPHISLNKTTNVQEWHISSTDLDYIADGCYLLGCGGGGNPGPGKIQLKDMLASGHRIRVVDSSDLPDEAVVYWGGRMGSPAAISERLQAHETVLAIQALMEYRHEKTFDALMGLEIGGSNGVEPFLWGSSRFFDRPVIDADFMGRANPMCWQTSLTVHRPGEFVPCAIDSGDGRTMIMTRAPKDEAVDKPLRGAIMEMGSLVGFAPRPTTARIARDCGVLNTISLSWRIGRAIAQAEANNTLSNVADAIIEEVGGAQSAKVLFRGKITAIERTLHKGHSVGVLNITQTVSDDDETASARSEAAIAIGGTLHIPFVNENIFAEHVATDGTKTILTTVPDLITVIDRHSGRAVGVPEYRYGCQVIVLGISCSPRWTDTPRGLEVGGPASYGYDDIKFRPIGKYVEPRSVITEYA